MHSIRSFGDPDGSLRDQEPGRRVRNRIRPVPRRQRRIALGRRGRGFGHRRRVRLRQVGVDAGGDGAVAVDRQGHRRPDGFCRPRPVVDEHRRPPQDHWQGHRHDLPGADGQPQSVLHGRLPDRGDAALPSGARQGGAARPRDRAVQGGRHSRSRAAAEILPAPDVGRPVPARHDRHGDRLRSRSC